MNVIRLNQEAREMKVMMITNSIKKSLDAGKTINYLNLVMSSKVNLNLSGPTTKDYIERAMFKLGIKKIEDLEDEKYAKLWSSTKDE